MHRHGRRVPAGLEERPGRARHRAAGLRLCLWRCIRRPLEFRRRHHLPAAGGPRLHGRVPGAAELAKAREREGARRAPSRVPRVVRQHGLDGQPLLRHEAPAGGGRLQPRRQNGQTPGPCGRRVRQPDPAGVPGGGHHHRRYRSVPAPPRPLRLLVRLGQALRPPGLRRGPHLLRHGRTLHRRDRRGAGRRHPGVGHHVHRRHGVQDPCGG